MSTWLDVSFGSSKTGIATVGFRQYKNDGTDAVARTTTGVVEVGGGSYGAPVTVHADAVGIEWDTGEGSPLYAHESLTDSLRAVLIEKILRNKAITDPDTGDFTIYDDDNATVLFTGKLWDDAAGTIAYSGSGADRRDRMT